MCADSVRVRFAPSPTGYLHVGGVRTALFNWLFARHHGGKFVLRIEDTDVARSTTEMTEIILRSLEWLGLNWDEGPNVGGAYGPYLQSERSALYREHAKRLVREGKAYPCYCTADELEVKKEKALASGADPKYDRTCFELTHEQRQRFEREGRRPAIRFIMPTDEKIVVNDVVRGECEFNSSVFGDFIILRSDGGASFHLANVVDDSLMRISHVIRGEDHFPNTPRHMLMYRAFGYPMPRFAHLSMILGPDRSKLSKRHGAVSMDAFRGDGYLPDALLNYLVLLGWSPPNEQEVMNRADMIAQFELERVNKSAAVFDYAKLNFMNSLRIREMPLEDVVALSREWFAGGEHADEAATALDADEGRFAKLVSLARERVNTLREIPEKCKSILQPPELSDEVLAELRSSMGASDVLKAFCEELQSIPSMTDEEIRALFKRVQKRTGVKGKGLYGPPRLALTGEQHGPELVGLFQVISREEIEARIQGALRRF